MIPLVLMIPLCIIYAASICFLSIRNHTGVKRIAVPAVAVAMTALVFAANLRVKEEGDSSDVALTNVDCLFVIDTTMSMWAEDAGKGTRIEAAVSDCKEIMEGLRGSSFAVLRFDNRSQVLSPYTQDALTVTDALETISMISDSYASGSSLNTPITETTKLLESSSSKEGRVTVLFFISDGEITDGSNLESFAGMADLIDSGAVMCYGSESGGKMKKESNGLSWSLVGMEQAQYVLDPETGKEAVSVPDMANMESIATDLGLPALRMPDDQGLQGAIHSVRSMARSELGKMDMMNYDDTHYRWIAALIPFEIALMAYAAKARNI
jgi:Ca-activated chloride channel family protein